MLSRQSLTQNVARQLYRCMQKSLPLDNVSTNFVSDYVGSPQNRLRRCKLPLVIKNGANRRLPYRCCQENVGLNTAQRTQQETTKKLPKSPVKYTSRYCHRVDYTKIILIVRSGYFQNCFHPSVTVG